MSGDYTLVTKTARAIADREFLAWYNSVNNVSLAEARAMYIQDNFRDMYIDRFRNWATGHSTSPIIGLDDFPKVAITNAITHSLDCFVAKCLGQGLNIRVFRGEYPYVKRLMTFHDKPLVYLDDQEVRSCDAVVLSYPFSATGDRHFRTFELLNECCKLRVPVFLDCAFWPACRDVPIILEHECIRHVAFSFSKLFPMSAVRVGIEFMREDVPHPMDVFSLGHYYNRLGAYLGYKLMTRFSPMYVTSRYSVAQHAICNDLKLIPSKTVIFGLSHDSVWDEYSREGVINRPCVTKGIERLMGEK